MASQKNVTENSVKIENFRCCVVTGNVLLPKSLEEILREVSVEEIRKGIKMDDIQKGKDAVNAWANQCQYYGMVHNSPKILQALNKLESIILGTYNKNPSTSNYLFKNNNNNGLSFRTSFTFDLFEDLKKEKKKKQHHYLNNNSNSSDIKLVDPRKLEAFCSLEHNSITGMRYISYLKTIEISLATDKDADKMDKQLRKKYIYPEHVSLKSKRSFDLDKDPYIQIGEERYKKKLLPQLAQANKKKVVTNSL